MQGVGYTDDGWAEKPSKGWWGHPEGSKSRKLLPLLGWKDKKRATITKQVLQHSMTCLVGTRSVRSFSCRKANRDRQEGEETQFFPPVFYHSPGNVSHWLHSAGPSSPIGLGTIAWRLMSQTSKGQGINPPGNRPRSDMTCRQISWFSAILRLLT